MWILTISEEMQAKWLANEKIATDVCACTELYGKLA